MQDSWSLKLRPIICLGFVLFSHLALIFFLQTINRLSTQKSPDRNRLQFISVVERSKSLSVPFTKQSSKANAASALKASHFINQSANSATEKTVTESESSEAMTEPKLDLDALRASAVRFEVERERSPIQLQNEKNLRNHSLEAAVEKGANEAQRADCRTAYATSSFLGGMFAPIRIASDLIRDKGCKF